MRWVSLILDDENRSRDAVRMSRSPPLHQMMQTGAGVLRLTQAMLYTRRNQLHLGGVSHQRLRLCAGGIPELFRVERDPHITVRPNPQPVVPSFSKYAGCLISTAQKKREPLVEGLL